MKKSVYAGYQKGAKSQKRDASLSECFLDFAVNFKFLLE
jgi:hypothetical protein